MYSMPSTPFTCSSIGVPTVSQTTCAPAPGYEVETCTVGGVICGYCSTGSDRSETMPKIIVTIAMTFAKTGRSMKKRGIIGRSRPLRGRGGRRGLHRLRRRVDVDDLPLHHRAGSRALQPVDHHGFARREAVLH